MTDVRARIKELDGLPVPALWARIQARTQDEDTVGSGDMLNRPSAGRRARAAVLAAVVFGVAGIFAWQALRPLHQVTVPSAAPRVHDAWSTLHRPLKLPQATGGTCPASPIVTIKPVGGGFSPGRWPAIGDGPAYVVAEPRDGTVLYRRNLVGGGWYGLKTIFTVDTSYRGPLLIRVAQIDGSGGIGLQIVVGPARSDTHRASA